MWSESRQPPRKDCPGCDTQINNRQISCDACWSTVPAEERHEIAEAYRGRRDDPMLYAFLRTEVTTWLRKNKTRIVR